MLCRKTCYNLAIQYRFHHEICDLDIGVRVTSHIRPSKLQSDGANQVSKCRLKVKVLNCPRTGSNIKSHLLLKRG